MYGLNPLLRGSLQSRTRLISRASWVCSSCRARPISKASYSVDTKSKKPYYVTTPIFYVNAAPHVGHLYTMVLADVFKRWQVLKGDTAILCTGTDEHGMKIQRAAAQAGALPKEFCDVGAETFKELAQRAGLSNDHFVRTTDPDHKETVEYIWYMLREREYIYESKHEGWYCVSDETFYPESAIEKRLDPFTGRTFIASQETGKEVEWTSEKNYHFRLSAFKEQLLEFYEKNPDFVVPMTRMKDVVNQVSRGLEDLSISRPYDRLSWGIRVPDDETQTVYVWLDALVNYITKAGYPWAPGKETAGGWPADVQVIGKDIVRFHCIYWPAFLLALNLPPPKQILTHAHWTMDNQKMSKSIGNVVNPLFAMDRFGVDVMRYYLIHDGGIKEDSDYGNEYIVERYKKGLQQGLGNLVSRLTRPKVWNVRSCVEATHSRGLNNSNITTSRQIDFLNSVRDKANEKMQELNAGSALHVIMDTVYETNKYIQHEAPWSLAKSEDPEAKERLISAVYHSAEAIRVVGILLQPYMPEKASLLLDMIGVVPERRTYEYAILGADPSYGDAQAPLGKGAWDGLFPPLAIEK
ncbi:putative methionyl-trna synthetase protein [Botrytis fragariae]|uniref:Probable methionine--tRNA ligase, mitochondrial n=1 Tax=Botrytis fragariae TaxID=1964551 RepID=A0A8H6AQT5_9HELO|nr:putative methionyl-trna synthetase protein [Botrytis fragariae]KAF5871902.1 putative methionyl-trna synthetase protein [Botrytis fragariae]